MSKYPRFTFTVPRQLVRKILLDAIAEGSFSLSILDHSLKIKEAVFNGDEIEIITEIINFNVTAPFEAAIFVRDIEFCVITLQCDLSPGSNLKLALSFYNGAQPRTEKSERDAKA